MSQRIAISLCTRDRPGMLADCLGALVPAIAAAEAAHDVTVHVVVVENDTVEKSRTIAEGMADLRLTYVLEPEPGIPQARNRGVEESLALGADWIVFIDDDETVEPGWLRAFLDARPQYDAEVLSGPRERIYPPDTPAWMPRNPGEPMVTGTEREATYTANTFAAARLFAAPEAGGLGLRFDPGLAHSGGEDTELFRRFTATGGRIVWIAEARLSEEVPPSRNTLAWHFARYARMADTGVLITRMHEGGGGAVRYALPKVANRLGMALLRGGLGLVTLITDRDRGLARLAGAWMNIGSAWGFARGLFGRHATPYKQVEGR